jgi:hypothetical protein
MLFRSFAAVAIFSSAILVDALPATLTRRAPLDVITHCTVNNTAALTFDDGPFNYIMVRALPPTLILNGLTRSPFLGHLESID